MFHPPLPPFFPFCGKIEITQLRGGFRNSLSGGVS